MKKWNSNVKRYFAEKGNHLNPAKVYIIDPRKGKFVQPLSIPEILAELKF